MSDNLSTEATIIPAWNMAVKNNKVTEELIFHSDRGSQYASYKFTNSIKKHYGLVKQSMSRKGNCWENALAESFFKSLKVEWVYKYEYDLKQQAELSVFSCKSNFQEPTHFTRFFRKFSGTTPNKFCYLCHFTLKNGYFSTWYIFRFVIARYRTVLFYAF